MSDHWYRLEMLRAFVVGALGTVCVLTLVLLVAFLRLTRRR